MTILADLKEISALFRPLPPPRKFYGSDMTLLVRVARGDPTALDEALAELRKVAESRFQPESADKPPSP